MADDATNYLQDELRKAQRTFRVGITVMGILVVFIIGYFQWLKSQTRDLLEPANVSEFIVNETRRNLPNASAALTNTIKEAAPEVVRFVMQQVIDVVFPLLRDSFQENFKEYSQALIIVGHDAAMTAFQDTVHGLKNDVKNSRQLGGDALATAASTYVTAQLGKRLDESSKAELGDKLAQSHDMLLSVNKRLKDMSGKSQSREDELAKRMITTWWSFLQQNRGEVPAGALTLPGGKLLDTSEITAPPGAGKKAAPAK